MFDKLKVSLLIIITFVLYFFAIFGSLRAEQITLQGNYKDTYISSYLDTSNFGASKWFKIGVDTVGTSLDTLRGLFTIGSIAERLPDNATVTDVSITFYVRETSTDTTFGSGMIYLYKLDSLYTEGSETGDSAVVNWIYKRSSSESNVPEWGSRGGDYSTLYDSVSFNEDSDSLVFSGDSLVAYVNNVLNGTIYDFGFLLKTSESDTSHIGLVSSDSTSYVPKVVFTFTVPARGYYEFFVRDSAGVRGWKKDSTLYVGYAGTASSTSGTVDTAIYAFNSDSLGGIDASEYARTIIDTSRYSFNSDSLAGKDASEYATTIIDTARYSFDSDSLGGVASADYFLKSEFGDSVANIDSTYITNNSIGFEDINNINEEFLKKVDKVTLENGIRGIVVNDSFEIADVWDCDNVVSVPACSVLFGDSVYVYSANPCTLKYTDNYIYVHKDSGDKYLVTDGSILDKSINFRKNSVLLGEIYMEDNTVAMYKKEPELHVQFAKLSDYFDAVHLKFIADGMTIETVTGTKQLRMNAGNYYIGYHRINTDSILTADTCVTGEYQGRLHWGTSSADSFAYFKEMPTDSVWDSDLGRKVVAVNNRWYKSLVYFYDKRSIDVQLALKSSESASSDLALTKDPPTITASMYQEAVQLAWLIWRAGDSNLDNAVVVDIRELYLPSEGSVGVTDHGLLTGLGDNDHPQYLLRSDLGDSLSGYVPDSAVVSSYADSSTHIPIATSSTLGGIKVGSGLNITDDGLLSTTGVGGSAYADSVVINGYRVPGDSLITIERLQDSLSIRQGQVVYFPRFPNVSYKSVSLNDTVTVTVVDSDSVYYEVYTDASLDSVIITAVIPIPHDFISFNSDTALYVRYWAGGGSVDSSYVEANVYKYPKDLEYDGSKVSSNNAWSDIVISGSSLSTYTYNINDALRVDLVCGVKDNHKVRIERLIMKYMRER